MNKCGGIIIIIIVIFVIIIPPSSSYRHHHQRHSSMLQSSSRKSAILSAAKKAKLKSNPSRVSYPWWWRWRCQWYEENTVFGKMRVIWWQCTWWWWCWWGGWLYRRNESEIWYDETMIWYIYDDTMIWHDDMFWIHLTTLLLGEICRKRWHQRLPPLQCK